SGRMGVEPKAAKGADEALNVNPLLSGSRITEPAIGPRGPASVTSCGVAFEPYRVMFPGIKGLVKVALKPSAAGVKELTVRPRVVTALLVPTMAGFVAAVSAAVRVWLPGVMSVALKMWTPLSLPAPVVNVYLSTKVAAAGSVLVSFTAPV